MQIALAIRFSSRLSISGFFERTPAVRGVHDRTAGLRDALTVTYPELSDGGDWPAEFDYISLMAAMSGE